MTCKVSCCVWASKYQEKPVPNQERTHSRAVQAAGKVNTSGNRVPRSRRRTIQIASGKYSEQ